MSSNFERLLFEINGRDGGLTGRAAATVPGQGAPRARARPAGGVDRGVVPGRQLRRRRHARRDRPSPPRDRPADRPAHGHRHRERRDHSAASTRSSRWRRHIRPSSPTPSSGRRVCAHPCRSTSPTCSSAQSARSRSPPSWPTSSGSSNRSPGDERVATGRRVPGARDRQEGARVARRGSADHAARRGDHQPQLPRRGRRRARSWCACRASARSCSASIAPAKPRRPTRAADLGIGPGARAELPGVGTLITEFVGGTPATTETLLAPGVLERVTELHPAPARSAGRSRRASRSSGSSSGTPATPRANGVDPPAVYDELHAAAPAIEAVFVRARWSRRCATTTCLPANVLLAPERLWLHRLRVRGHERRAVRPRQPVGQLRLRRSRRPPPVDGVRRRRLGATARPART